MLDWLVKIPGTEFVKYFSLMSLICIGVAWWLVRVSNGGYPLPDKNQFDPITFAVLQGRWQAAIDVVVVQLIERNIVEVTDKDGYKTLSIKTRTVDLSPVEHVVYDYLVVPKSGSQFDGADIQVAMENELQSVYRELENMHLYKTEEEVVRGKITTYFILFCLEVLAITKIYFAIIYNKPFLILAILMLGIYFAVVYIVRPGDRVTRLGRQYVREVKNHFAWLKTGLSNSRGEHSFLPNYAMRTAIFGVGILAYSEMFDGYQAFAQDKRELERNNSGSGDGSGGDSGSSDGGGSSGCGGCGGGD